MKNLYVFVLLAFCCLEADAQIVNIPDPAFKNMLVNTICTTFDPTAVLLDNDVDTNDDGEIQVTEALAVTNLQIGGVDTFNLSGIEAFSNLQTLWVGEFDHIDLDLSGVPSLVYIEMHTGTVTSLNFSGLINLKSFNTSYIQFSAADYSSLTALEYFGAHETTMPSLDLSNLPNLKSIEVVGAEGANLAYVNFSDLPQLEKLYCSNLGLTTLDLSGLDNLIDFACDSNQLTSIDISHLTQLTQFSCGDNQLTSIDVSHSPDLQSFECRQNQLTDLDITNNPNILYLYCQTNLLTSLDLSNATNLYMLYCGNNQLTTLNTTNLTHLGWINASSNLFTSLDFSYSLANNWHDLDFANNPNLTYLNIKNGAGMIFHQFESFDVTNCPNLQYICADEMNFYDIDAPQAVVSSYCSFTPGGVFNTISGTLTFDLNNNGCDTGDALSLNSKMKMSHLNSNGVTFADASGNYSFFAQAGNYTIMPEFENPYFIVSPTSATVNFVNSDGSTQTQNFCIAPNGIHNDVEITIIPTQVPRPGFNAGYRLVYKNKGNQVLSGSINLAFDDAVLDFVSAFPGITNQALNTLTWNYNNLLPFENRSIDIVLNVNSPQEVPPVNNGDVLNFTATINPVSGDDTVADNTFELSQNVLGSYDPNDKTCLEGNSISPEMIGEYLHYVIRFQNSGTAAAENIVVKDVIDASQFDITSLQITSVSHPYVARISGNKVEFIFEGINLPAEQDNETGSHGYVAFKIKTKNNLVLGNSVSNKADIYFDYNFPIETEPATSVFSVLARNTYEDQSIEVYPNPVKNKLTINADEDIKSILIFDRQGRMIENTFPNTTNVKMNLSPYASGIYFVKITTSKGLKTQKIIKQ